MLLMHWRDLKAVGYLHDSSLWFSNPVKLRSLLSGVVVTNGNTMLSGSK